MLLVVALASLPLAHISPLAVDVTTADGSRRVVHVVDADALPVQVCARRADSAAAPVCGDVVADRYGLHARVDVTDDDGLVYELVVTRFDARTYAPAAVAGGFAVATVLAVVGATAASIASSSLAVDDDVAAALDEGISERQDVSDRVGQVAVGLWIGAAAGAVATSVATYFAVADAQQRYPHE